MKIIVIDGQGGKMGKMMVEQIKKRMPDLELVAIGTNSIATAAMLKAGADHGATGENPVVFNSKSADVIIGPIGIVVANALLGEVTPKMAQAVGESDAYKLLVPVNKCRHIVIGKQNLSLSEYILLTVEELMQIINH
ncbi:DUF3842 family protein [Cellulosilyticum sp. I15G10I2]|uniref:DUF3842 family protein n=1 Tax=Cellulosilyticum sp. I15G10I2 TaxID=1892843 RepID=UPI00085CABDB|nr:DUF3842 family protein [Cellulosilyticum sp. I15G10I2]